MYVELPDAGDLDDIDGGDLDIGGDDDEGGGGDDSDDDAMGGKGATAAPQSTKIDPNAPLPTPAHIKAIGYMRCNCTEGMVEGSKRFKPLDKRQYCGGIEVATWERLQDAPPPQKLLTADQEEALEKKAEQERNRKFRELLPWVHRFCELGKESAAMVKVSKAWYDGTVSYAPYVEMRDCVPIMSYRVHQGQVDSMALVIMPGTNQRVLFTGGDRRVMSSDIDKGEIITLITRDSGEIPLLFETEFKLITASSNGSIRMFDLSHVLSRTKLTRTVWEHSRYIRGMLMAEPSEGYCRAHGIENHVCEFYTASEDRRIIMWDQQSSNPIRSIENKTIRHHSFISLGQTRRHLIAGTSDASIFVFAKHDECERNDLHACSTPGSKKIGCLQVALRLPGSIRTTSGMPATVVCLEATRTDPDYDYGTIEDYDPDDPLSKDPNYANMRLYAGDVTGQMTVWAVPEFYGIDYRPILTRKLHDGSLNKITTTRSHLVTLGDDGVCMIMALQSMVKVRKVDVHLEAMRQGFTASERVKRKLKCVTIHYDSDGSGTMIIGTSFGDVYVFPLGKKSTS